MKENKLSVVLATRNEEKNIEDCLKSVSSIADEMIVVDESSSDNTREIAEALGARVHKVKHSKIFHKTKQIALEMARNKWILQLDADERVTTELANEILSVINMSDEEINKRDIPKRKLRVFTRHTQLLKNRGEIKEGKSISAFLLPRLNYFLGKPLKHAGVYPDPAVRLIKKGEAYFPAKSVHENMKVKGSTTWLFNDLEHHDSPTLERYLSRLNRYTNLQSQEMKKDHLPLNIFYLFYYSFVKPFFVFLKLYLRHKGFKDGMRGFVWSSFSSLHFPISYFKYWSEEKK